MLQNSGLKFSSGAGDYAAGGNIVNSSLLPERSFEYFVAGFCRPISGAFVGVLGGLSCRSFPRVI